MMKINLTIFFLLILNGLFSQMEKNKARVETLIDKRTAAEKLSAFVWTLRSQHYMRSSRKMDKQQLIHLTQQLHQQPWLC